MLLALLLAAALPAGCVLWFMTAAMRNETLAARQRLGEVYRQQLGLSQGIVQRFWEQRAGELAKLALPERSAAQAFKSAITARLADAVLIYGPSGELRYPTTHLPASASPEPAQWAEAEALEAAAQYLPAAEAYARIAVTPDARLQAFALLAQGRCLALAGRAAQAREVLARLTDPRLLIQRDETGRLIAPEALLHAVRLGADSRLRQQVADLAADYAVPMLSAQRCVLLKEAAPDLSQLADGEALSLEALEAMQGQRRPASGKPVLLRQRGDLWMLICPGGEAIGLLHPQTVRRDTLAAVTAASTFAGARVEVRYETDSSGESLPLAAVPAGPAMPGWSLAVYLQGTDPLLAAGARQRLVYAWTAAAAIAAIVLAAVATALYLARQLRLTRLKNDLIATVSHELKTPLASSRVLLETLLAGRTTTAQQQREYLELIARENQRLGRLIDNFLTFSRMERDRHAFELQPIHPQQFIQPAVEAVRERFSPSEAELVVKLDPALPPVNVDRDAMETVVLNLLDNAWKYTLAPKRVQLRVTRIGDELCIEVSDNGIGLTARQAARVFDRFYQADRTLSRRVGGCGLGLSIVKFIVQAHGGRVAVRSQRGGDGGGGSTFSVYLPLAQEAQTEP